MILGLKPAELPRFGKVALAFTLTQVTALVGYLAATTLFLQACGAAYLPRAFLSGYLLALAITSNLRRASHVPPFTMLAAYFSLYAAFQIACSLVGAEGGFWVRWLMLTCIVPFPVLCLMLFWNTLQSRLLLREVKVWTPLIMAAATLGQVVTGFSMGPLGRTIGIHNTFALSGLSLLGSIVVLKWALADSAGGGPAPVEEPTPAEGVSDPLVTQVAGLVFMGALFKYIVDLQLNAAAAAAYGTVAEVAGFLGRFDSFVKIAIFIVQTAFTRLLLSKMPPGRLLGAMPVLLAVAAVAVLAGAGFGAILAGNFLFTIFDKGTNRTCISLLLAPFPPGRARQARLKLDGQAMGAGVITISLLMIAFPAILQPRVAFAAVLGLCLVYRAWCASIDVHYIAALRANLSRGAGDVRAEALGHLRAFGGERQLEVLEEMLASSERDQRRLAALELARTGDAAAANLLRKALEKEEDPRVQSVLIAGLPRMHAGAEAVEPLLASPDARVRANALEALARLSSPRAVALAGKHLASEEPRPRASAAVAVALNAQDKPAMVQALTCVRDMLVSPDATTRAAACWAMGRIGHRSLVRALAERLGDPDLVVRRQAALGLERVWSPAALPALQAAAADPANAEFRPVLARAIDRIEDRTRHEVAAALGTLSREQRDKLAVRLADLGRDEVALLARALRIEDPGDRMRVGQAIEDAKDPLVRAALERAIRPAGDVVGISLAELARAARAPGAPLALWGLLERLATPAHRGELADAALEALVDFCADVIPLADDSPLPAARMQDAARLVGLAAGDPGVGTTMLEAVSSGEARALSLCSELIEKVVERKELRRGLLALVEASGDRNALKRAASEIRARVVP